MLRRCTKLRGLDTCWLEGGNPTGPIMLLIHGFPDSPATWNHQIDVFQDRYWLIAPYLRGVLPSQKPRDWRRFHPVSQSLDILEILKSLPEYADRRIVIVAHDIGSMIAYRLAAFLGQKLARLIIINGLSERQFFASYLSKFSQARRSPQLLALQFPTVASQLLPRNPMFFLRAFHRQGGLKASLRPPLSATLPGMVQPSKIYRSLWAYGWNILLEKPVAIQCSTLILWGEEEGLWVNPNQKQRSLETKQAIFKRIPGNHWVHRERPTEVNQTINQFLLSGAI